MNALAILLTAVLALEPAPAPNAQTVSAVSGNGKLVGGLDRGGVLAALRWPGPGGPDQMRQPSAEGGGRWGIETGGKWHWFGDPSAHAQQEYEAPGSDLIVTTVQWTDGVIAVQRMAVLADHDALACLVDVANAASPPRIVWIAAFAPSTRQVPELPASEGALDALNGFAAFVERDQNRAWSFRPANPREADWGTARDLVRTGGTSAAWSRFDDGAWIAVTGAPPLKNLVATSSSSEAVAAITGGVSLFSSAVGNATLAIEPQVEQTSDGYRAWIAIGIGANDESVVRMLSNVQTGVDHVTGNDAPVRAMPSALSEMESSELSLVAPHWTALRTLHDDASGFTVRSLSAVPSYARDWPREGAIAAWALDVVTGDANAAEKSIVAYLAQVRTDDWPRKPFGSMPESLYTNGEIASPHFVVDDRSVARVLWVADCLIAGRAPEARARWVLAHWKSISAAVDFLAAWADVRRGAPLWCKDPLELSDEETQDRLFAAHAGMSAAIRLADYAGLVVSDSWRARQAQLRELTEWVLTTAGKWQAGSALVLEFNEFAEQTMVQVHDVLVQRLDNATGQAARPIAGLLLEYTLLHEQVPGLAPSLAPQVVKDALDRIADQTTAGASGVDAFVSSQVLLAAVLNDTP